MRIKLLMLVMGLFLMTPIISYAQYTDDDLDYQGGNTDNGDWGPVSLEPELIEGVISYTQQIITNTYNEDLGLITVWVVDEQGKLYISEEVNTTKEKVQKIDIKSLPEQKYKIICFTPEGEYTATFEIK